LKHKGVSCSKTLHVYNIDCFPLEINLQITRKIEPLLSPHTHEITELRVHS